MADIHLLNSFLANVSASYPKNNFGQFNFLKIPRDFPNTHKDIVAKPFSFFK